MPCIPGVPVTCIGKVVDGIGGGVGDTVGDALGNSFAEAMRDGAAWVIQTTIGWWIEVPAIDLTSSPADTIRGYIIWLAAVVATAGIIWQGIVLAVSRRPDPALQVGRGLFTLAFWGAVGIIGPAAALRAGDAFSTWVLSEAAHGQASDRLVKLASLGSIESPGAVIILGLVMMLAGLAQACLMMFREASLIILAGLVVLAAAGSFTHATRPWLPRLLGWMLALIIYKPAAALVYATALTLVGDGDDPRTVIVGLVMMILAIAALPVLMKFFTWTAGTATGGGGGMAALAGASAAAIHGSVALSSKPGASAARQADHVRQDLGATGGIPMPRASSTPFGAGGGSPSAATGTAGGTAPGGFSSSAALGARAGGTATGGTAGASAGASSASASGAAGAGAAAGPVGAVIVQGASTAVRAARGAGEAMTQEGPQ